MNGRPLIHWPRALVLALPLSLIAGQPLAAPPGELEQALQAEQMQLAQQAAQAQQADLARHGEQAEMTDESKLSEADQLAIAALRTLMTMPPEQALPRIRKVLEGPRSDAVKTRAVFVLSQVDSTEASQLLADMARSGQGRTQLEAIRSLGIRGDANALKAVHALVNDPRPEIRAATREAMIIANDRAGLLALAKSAKNEEDARSAIEALGAIGATQELRSLADAGVKSSQLLSALAMSGDKDSLLRVIKTDGDTGPRAEALRMLGLLPEPLSTAEWQQIYATMPNRKLKRAVLNGLIIAADDRTLLRLYQQEKDLNLKREILNTLSIVGGDAALDAIDAAIEGQQP